MSKFSNIAAVAAIAISTFNLVSHAQSSPGTAWSSHPGFEGYVDQVKEHGDQVDITVKGQRGDKVMFTYNTDSVPLVLTQKWFSHASDSLYFKTTDTSKASPHFNVEIIPVTSFVTKAGSPT